MAAPLMALKGGVAAEKTVDRFFAALVVSLGKPAIERTEVRQGRRVVMVRWGVPAYTVETHRSPPKPSSKSGPAPIETRTISVPRWAAAIGVVGAVVLAASTSKGATYVSDAKGHFPNAPNVSGWVPLQYQSAPAGSTKRMAQVLSSLNPASYL